MIQEFDVMMRDDDGGLNYDIKSYIHIGFFRKTRRLAIIRFFRKDGSIASSEYLWLKYNQNVFEYAAKKWEKIKNV